MKIEVATLVEGSESDAGDGITDAKRCVLTLPDGTLHAAVLKRAPLGHVAAECFSALLLKAWGLDVPTPYVVQVDGGIAFASADAGYPSLKQRLGINALPEGPLRDAAIKLAAELTSSFASTPLALAADEAIDNRDRNLGNILWDGAAETWIDHAMALGEGAHMDDLNKLATMAVMVGSADMVQASAIAQSLALDRSHIETAALATSDAVGSFEKANFVADRVARLGMLVLARFPQPHDLLSP
ncbi:hypothetical protein FB547_10920 [Variovorax beijingensis]|uniref:Uncharacterized protein n=1 Tax=Variovorax beijingensis TaxID=2496117 RepID=A0A561BF24_9BURK|nr:hypothetical protein [Variovorax beijingensis]TWD77486.1 hypothetical protein FB547_10920 [Variovorax beijingensis]